MSVEYDEYLRRNLSVLERLGDKFSGLDERLDYTNALLRQIVILLRGQPIAAPGTSPGTSIVDVRLQSSPNAIPNRAAFVTGQKDVAAAGTAVQLMESSLSIPDGFYLTIIAKPANTGYIYVANSNTGAEGASRLDGLSAGLAVSLRITDVNLVWVDASVSGEGVSWIMER